MGVPISTTIPFEVLVVLLPHSSSSLMQASLGVISRGWSLVTTEMEEKGIYPEQSSKETPAGYINSFFSFSLRLCLTISV